MPDALTAEDVRRIASLARLALTDDEVDLYARQLARILDYAGQVAALDMGDVPPTFSTSEASGAGRPDEPRASLGREEALANAPDTAAGLFRVPRVLGDA